MQKLEISIRSGMSVHIPIRIESDSIEYVDITAMEKSAPLRVTVPNHPIPDGWRACIQNAGGMSTLNAEWEGLRDLDLRRVVVIDANTVAFPGINASGFRTYSAGGQIAFYAPKNLSSYTAARMEVKTAVGGELLCALTITDGTLEIDAEQSAVWMHLSPTTLVDLGAGKYVFDIELTDGVDVLAVCSADSTITVLPEITTGV